MPSFTCREFHDATRRLYQGSSIHKEQLWAAINLICKDRPLEKQQQVFESLLAEAKGLFTYHFDPDDVERKFNRGKDNYLNNLSKGEGDYFKALALNFLFLSNPAYEAAADKMNASLFPGETPEEAVKKLLEEREKDTADHTRTVEPMLPSRAHKDPLWGLYETGGRSFSELSFTFGLEDRRQRSKVGTTVDTYLTVSVRHASSESDYEYGFRKVVIENNIRSEDTCQLKFCDQYRSEQEIGESIYAWLQGPTYRKTMVLEARKAVLNGDYEFGDTPFMVLSPENATFKFEARMIVQKRDMSIAKTDGSALPSNVKAQIIKALIARELGAERGDGFIVVCSYDYEIRPDMRNPLQYG